MMSTSSGCLWRGEDNKSENELKGKEPHTRFVGKRCRWLNCTQIVLGVRIAGIEGTIVCCEVRLLPTDQEGGLEDNRG